MLLEINTETLTPDTAKALSTFLLTLVGETALATGTVTPVGRVAHIPSAADDNSAYGVTLTPNEAAEALMAAASAGVVPAAPDAATAIRNADGTPKLDAEGLPWDARIHSSNQKMTAKGVWTAVRNLDPATGAKVRAELAGAMTAPAVPVAVPPPPTATAAPAPLPPPADPVAAPPPPTDAPVTFADMMMHVVGLQTAGTITPEEITANCVALGLASVRDFASRPDLIPSMMAMLPARQG